MIDDDPDPARSSPDLAAFVRRVQHTAGLASESEAEVLSRATLRHLGQQISVGVADALSSDLPDELGDELVADRRGHADGLDKQTLLEQVSAHVHAVDVDDVEKQVHAVLSTVRSSASDRHVESVLAQLPPAVATLFA